MLDLILSIEPGEDKLAWCSVLYRFWRKLQRPARHLSTSFIAHMRVRTANELLRVFFDFLPVVRGWRLQSDIAELLGQWLVRHQEEASQELRDRVRRALYHAAENERRRISALTQRRFLPGPRTRLRNLLSSLGRAEMLQPPEPSRLSVLVDACKAIDGDDPAPSQADTSVQIFSQPDFDLREELVEVSETTPEQQVNSEAPAARKAVLNFFIAEINARSGALDGSFVTLSRDDGEEVFPLPGVSSCLREFREFVLGLDGGPAGGWNRPGLAKSLDRLRRVSGSQLEAPTLAKFWESATALGKMLFPEELKTALATVDHLVLVPDGHLFALPLHLLPTAGGSLLIENHAISYRPKQSYGAQHPSLPPKSGSALVCINTEDENIGSAAESILAVAGESENTWEARTSPKELLSRLANTQTGIFLLHGHTCFTSRLLHRIALRDGARLTALDILLSKVSFAETNVFLMACHSADPHIERAREMLGLASAFLHRNARAVLASIWKCEIPDACEVLRALLAADEVDAAVPQRYRALLLEVSNTLSRPELFLRYGPFILYGHW